MFERNCRRQVLQKTNEGEWGNIMNEKLQIIFGLLGGLAVFIYGMNMMSECLQKAAGEKMKSILALLTKNPVLGLSQEHLLQRYYRAVVRQPLWRSVLSVRDL